MLSVAGAKLSFEKFQGMGSVNTIATLSENVAPPAQWRDASGHARIKLGAIIALSAPIVANSALQTVLSLTDAWFIGRISISALASIAAIYLPISVVIALFAGVGLATQTIAAHAYGSRRFRRAAQAAWTSVWAAVFVTPAFALIAAYGSDFLHPLELAPEIEALAIEFWQPRMIGAPLGLALGGLLGFFNGVSLPRITLAIGTIVATSNAVLAPLFMFNLGFGISGAAWATNCAQTLGLAAGLYVFLSSSIDGVFHSRLVWPLRAQRLWLQWKLGFPIGLLSMANMAGFGLFLLMQVRLGPVDGAAAQIVVMLTSIAFLPAAGIAITGSVLIGQTIGYGDRRWARRIGNTIIIMCVIYMGCIGLLLGLGSSWLIPMFLPANDPQAGDVVNLGVRIMWIAAAYQIFEGLAVSSACCLRGAGDALVPATLIIALSGLLFVPLAHMLSFEGDTGWVNWLPQFGLGAMGGWIAVLLFSVVIGFVLALRWRSPVWESIQLR